ncbi:MAG: tRNA 2-thiocytidine biosynthesis TtcA family protein [Christensenellales bacterium]
MKLQMLMGKVRKVCEMYDLIEDGDKIAVGVSGGKDSLTLLNCLADMRIFYPKKYEVLAIAVDLFNGKTDYTKIKEFCKKLNVELVVVNSDINNIVFNIRKEKNPCSLCANLRRGILNSSAKQYGCNKVALGHHSDDLVETFLMSMFYESRLNTFLPKTYLTNNDITVIRPMILLDEKDISSYAKNLPVLFNECPADKHTTREEIKQLIFSLNKTIPQVKQHILSALMNPQRNCLFDKMLNNDKKNEH